MEVSNLTAGSIDASRARWYECQGIEFVVDEAGNLVVVTDKPDDQEYCEEPWRVQFKRDAILVSCRL
jgi:hypothetical protein